MSLLATSRDKSKSPDHALGCRLETEAGLSPAQVRVVCELLTDHLQHYFSDTRPPGVVIHTAVAASEPAGKPIKKCVVLPVHLTYFCDSDLQVERQRGTVQMRALRLYRLCREAQQQRGLLSHEDLAHLLCVDASTVKELVKLLREQGLNPPTRGAIKDIGPEPSHKRDIAKLLGRGLSTSEVRSATNHSEGSIGRYQLQFAMVLYLLHTFPKASHDELCRVSGLHHKPWNVYVEVARELTEQDDCRPHLQRLRRRYEVDPEQLHRQIPAGKRPQDLATQRLEQQSLDTALRQTIQQDLGTTPRVATAVAEDLRKVIDEAYKTPDALRPGEVTVFVDAQDSAFLSGERVADRSVIPVTVPLFTEEAKKTWRSDEPVGQRRALVAVKAALAAQEQGGVMTVAGLAELLHVSPGTMGKDLRELAVKLHVETPTKGLIEDAGPTLTHKDWIIGLDQHGLTGEEISWLTRHAPHSRDRYIETYRRAETLTRLQGTIPQPEQLARLLRLRLSVATQYVDLLRRYHTAGKDSPDFAGTPHCSQLAPAALP